MIMGLFGAILVTILRVQGEQNSSSSVSSDLSFMMTTIKRHIHEAVTVTIPESNPNELDIVKNDSTVTILYNGPTDTPANSIMVTDSSISPTGEKINSNQINIDGLQFEKLQDATNPASIAVRITITASADTTDPTRQSTRTLQATASPFLQSQ